MKHLWWLLPLSLLWLWSYVIGEAVGFNEFDKNWWGFPLFVTAITSWVGSLFFTFSRVDK